MTAEYTGSTASDAPPATGTTYSYWFCRVADPAFAPCPTVDGVPAYYSVTAIPVRADTGAKIGPVTWTYLDSLGRVIQVETEGFDGSAPARRIQTDTRYDQFGRVRKASLPYYVGETILYERYEYDALGRPQTVYARDNGTTQFTYSGNL